MPSVVTPQPPAIPQPPVLPTIPAGTGPPHFLPDNVSHGFGPSIIAELNAERPFGIKRDASGGIPVAGLWERLKQVLPAEEVALLAKANPEKHIAEWMALAQRGGAEQEKYVRENIPTLFQNLAKEYLPAIEVKLLRAEEDLDPPDVQARRARITEIGHILDGIDPEWERKWVQYGDAQLRIIYPPETIALLQEREALIEDLPADANTSVTRALTGVNPKPLDQMPGAADQLIRSQATAANPQSFSAGHWGPDDVNIVGWNRMYFETLPNGEKVLHIFENQSDWAQRRRRQVDLIKEQTELVEEGLFEKDGVWHYTDNDGDTHPVPNNPADKKEALRNTILLVGLQLEGAPIDWHPYLDENIRLAMKAAIQYALANGATKIAISDSDTAMITEWHDHGPVPKPIFAPKTATQALGIHARVWRMNGGSNAGRYAVGYVQDAYQRLGIVDTEEMVIPQADGMRVHYDVAVPSVLKELTGSEPQTVSFGTHKNVLRQESLSEPAYTSDVYPDRESAEKAALGLVGARSWEPFGENIYGPNLPFPVQVVHQSGQPGESWFRVAMAPDSFRQHREIAERAGFTWSNLRPNLFIKNEDGSFKTDITARVFDLSKAADALKARGGFTLFGKDKPAAEAQPKKEAAPKAPAEPPLLSKPVDKMTTEERTETSRKLVQVTSESAKTPLPDHNKQYLEAAVKAAEEEITRRQKKNEDLNKEIEKITGKKTRTPEDEAQLVKLRKRGQFLSKGVERLVIRRDRARENLANFGAAQSTVEAALDPENVEYDAGLNLTTGEGKAREDVYAEEILPEDVESDEEAEGGAAEQQPERRIRTRKREHQRVILRPGYFEVGDPDTDSGPAALEALNEFDAATDDEGKEAAGRKLAEILLAQWSKKDTSGSLSRRVVAWRAPTGEVIMMTGLKRTGEDRGRRGQIDKVFRFATKPQAAAGKSGAHIGIRSLLELGYRPHASMLLQAPRYQLVRTLPSLNAFTQEYGPLKAARREAFRYTQEPATTLVSQKQGEEDTKDVVRDTKTIIGDTDVGDPETVQSWLLRDRKFILELGMHSAANPDKKLPELVAAFRDRIRESVQEMVQDPAAQEELVSEIESQLEILAQQAVKHLREIEKETNVSEATTGTEAVPPANAEQGDLAGGGGGQGTGQVPQEPGSLPAGAPGAIPAEAAAQGTPVDLDAQADAIQNVNELEAAGSLSKSAADQLRAQMLAATTAEELDYWDSQAFARSRPTRNRLVDPSALDEVDFTRHRLLFPRLLPDSVRNVVENIRRLVTGQGKISPSRRGLLGTQNIQSLKRLYPSLQDALLRISREGADRRLRDLAAAMHRTINLTGVTMEIGALHPPGKKHRGIYKWTQGIVNIYPENIRDEDDLQRTIVHEAAHAYTTRMYERFQNGHATEDERLLLYDLQKLAYYAKEAGITWQQSDSPHIAIAFGEFVSEIYTNEKVAADAAKVAAPGEFRNNKTKSLWDAIKEVLARIFQMILGNKPVTQTTKEANILDVAGQLVTDLVDGYNAESAALDKQFQEGTLYPRNDNEAIRYREVEGLVGTKEEITYDPSVHGVDPTAEASRMMAVTNEVAASLEKMMREWERKGGNRSSLNTRLLSYEQFIKAKVNQVLSAKYEVPSRVRDAIIQALTNQNHAAVSPALRRVDLAPSEALHAAVEELMMLQRVRNGFQKEFAMIREEFDKKDLTGKVAQLASELMDITKRYQDINITKREFLKEMRRAFKGDEDSGAASFLKALTGVADADQIEAAMDEIRNNFDDHADAVQAMAELGLDFSTLRIRGGLTPVDVKRAVTSAWASGTGVTELADLANDDALLAVTLQFAKRRPLVMDLLSIRRKPPDPQLTTLRRVMELSMSDRDDAFDLATQEISRMSTLGALAQRVSTQLRSIRREYREKLDDATRYAEWETFYLATYGVLDNEIKERERFLGIEGYTNEARQWDATDGQTYFVADSPHLTEAELFSVADDNPYRRELKLGEGHFHIGRIREEISKNNKWLAANKAHAGTPNYRLMERMNDRLAKVSAEATDLNLKRGIWGWALRAFTPVDTRLEATGVMGARQAAQRVRKFQTLYDTHMRTTASSVFHRFSKAQQDAKIATGMENSEEFMRRYYHDVFGYLENRQDLLDPKLSFDAQTDAAMAAARRYLNNPKGWDKLEAFLRLAIQGSIEVQNIRRAMNLLIKDELTDGTVIFREVIGHPAFTMSRLVSAEVISAAERMRDITRWESPFLDHMGVEHRSFTAKTVAAMFKDPNGQSELIRAIAARFDPETAAVFAKPIAYKPGKSAFLGPEINGVRDRCERANVIAAWDAATTAGSAAGGSVDVLLFATELHRREGGVPENLPEFVGSTLEVFQQYYSKLGNIAKVRRTATVEDNTEVGRSFLDARQGEDLPPEFLEYRGYGRVDQQRYVRILAAQAAYGNDAADFNADVLAGIRSLSQLISEFREAQALIDSRDPVLQAKGRDLMNKDGKRVARMNAVKNLAALTGASDDVKKLHKVLSGSPPEEQLLMMTLGSMAGSVVQGVTTGTVDTVTLAESPFRKFGFGGPALDMIFNNYRFTAAAGLESLFQAFGQQIYFNAEYQRETKLLNGSGLADLDAQIQRRGVMAYVERYEQELGDEMTMRALWNRFKQAPISTLPTIGGSAVRRVNRAARAFMETGIGKARDPELAAVTLKPFAPFTQIQGWMHRGAARAWLRIVNKAIKKGAAYFATHPADASNPAFLFNTKNLQFSGTAFGNWIYNQRAFEYLNETLQRHGISLEEASRKLLRGQPPLTKDQTDSVISLAHEETLLNNGITTRPSWMVTSAVGRAVSPLSGWAVAKLGDVLKTTLDPKFNYSHRAFGGAMFAFVAGVMPASLVYAFLRDEYEEEVLGKKQNVLPVAMAPLAILDNLGRMGALGIAGEALNSIFNVSTNREFSVDQRVFFLNSIMNLTKTLGTLIGQDGTATWATVYRPLLTSLGAGGYLQNFDAINNTLNLDNAERRVVRRINVSNQLRAAGRDLGLEVRIGRPITSTPNPIKPWVGEMVLAAYANDPTDFHRAYQAALNAAAIHFRDSPGVDPYERVASSYAGMHPLRTVLRNAATASDYQRLLDHLGEDGTEVAEAIRYYNVYGSQVPRGRGKEGLAPFYGTKPSEPNPFGSGARRRSSNRARYRALAADL